MCAALTHYLEFGNLQMPNETKLMTWRENACSPTPTMTSDSSSLLGSVGGGSSSAASTVSDDGSGSMATSPSATSAFGGQSPLYLPSALQQQSQQAAAAMMTSLFLANAAGVNCGSVNNLMAPSAQGNVAQRKMNAINVANQFGSQHRKLNRSQSEPAASISGIRKPGQVMLNNNASRYKTELCHPFEENGSCKYGDKCQFAHGKHELRNLVRHPKYKTELCRTFHAEGYCPYGTRCHFIHDETRYPKPKPSPLCLLPPQLTSADLASALSPSSVHSLSPSPVSGSAAAATYFTFASALGLHHLSSMCTPPSSPSSTESRLPVFDRLSSSTSSAAAATSSVLNLSKQYTGLTA